MREDYELPGQFYLGKRVNPENGQENGIYLYNSSDLTRHAVCVGMTGSGKTGLCIDLLEEAVIDGIPAIVIDPKGDMTNLALTFEKLEASSFLPWIREDQATKEEKTREELAEGLAKSWKEGLALWGQDQDRIRLLNECKDLTIYTPASSAGVPISIASVGSYPGPEMMKDREGLSDLLSSTANSFLNLLGLQEDPMTSEKLVLISKIIETAWSQEKSIGLKELVSYVSDPPFNTLGVMDLESFYPKKDRMKLAMMFNALLASPGAAAWFEGRDLDIQKLFYNDKGKARLSIISINHLDMKGQMFFVSLLLNKVLEWMKKQSGTSSLRAILYMDEIFGFFPPVENPPSKKPLLTLLKQARAYGLGLVLATQNPSDLDYKGLSNIGTWFIGRLQTKQDKDRLLDGLKVGEGSAFEDKAKLSDLLSKLEKRSFLVNNVDSQGPELIKSRWAMSYLVGPLTENQIKMLKEDEGSEGEIQSEVSLETIPEARPEEPGLSAVALPKIDGVKQYVFDQGKGAYLPLVYGLYHIAYSDRSMKRQANMSSYRATMIKKGPFALDWKAAYEVDGEAGDFSGDLPEGSQALTSYLKVGGNDLSSKDIKEWERSLKDYLYRGSAYILYKNVKTGLVSEVGESFSDFTVRVDMKLREERDKEVKKLRDSYSKKIDAAQNKIARAEQTLEREENQAERAKQNTFVNVGSAILDGLLGRKFLSKTMANKAASAARAASRQREQYSHIAGAKENMEARQAELAELEEKLESDLKLIEETYSGPAGKIEEVKLSPNKTSISIESLFLLWVKEDSLKLLSQED